jgi:hypothetical protein
MAAYVCLFHPLASLVKLFGHQVRSGGCRLATVGTGVGSLLNGSAATYKTRGTHICDIWLADSTQSS